MKKKTLLFLFCQTLLLAQAQDCNYYEDLMRRAKSLWANGNFEQAINQLTAAREDCPSKSSNVDAQLVAFTNEIARRYKEAETEKSTALREANRADSSALASKIATMKADSMAETNQRAAYREYANALAYKSSLALQEGDRNTAFRLAEFAELYVDSGNLDVRRALFDAAYCNIINPNQRLLRSSDYIGKKAWCFALSPISGEVATGGQDSIIRIWNLEARSCIKEFRVMHRSVADLAFSPDGKVLALGSHERVTILDLALGKEKILIESKTDFGNKVAFSPNGIFFAAFSGKGNVQIWNKKDWTPIETIHCNLKLISEFSFSSSGRLLIWKGLGFDKFSALEFCYRINSSKFVKGNWPRTSFFHLGNHIATDVRISRSGKGNLEVFQLRTRKRTMLEDSGRLYFDWTLSTSKKLVAAKNTGHIRVWDLESGTAFVTISQKSISMGKMAFSTNDQHLICQDWLHGVQIWGLAYEKFRSIRNIYSNSRGGFSFDSSSSHILTYGKNKGLIAWDIPNDRRSLEFNIPLDTIIHACWAADGKKIGMCFPDHPPILLDMIPNETIDTISIGTVPGSGIVFSPDGRQVAIACKDQRLRIFDTQTQQLLHVYHASTNCGNCLAFSNSSSMLACAGSENSIRIWDTKLNQELFTLRGQHSEVSCIAFSQNESFLASGSNDGNVMVWNLRNQRLMATLRSGEDFTGKVKQVHFSPDGGYLAAANENNQVVIWDLKNFDPCLSLRGSNVAFLDGGKRLATGISSGSIVFWDLVGTSIIRAWKEEALCSISPVMLKKYKLENLLTLHPENEAKLIATKELWQIKAFADLEASQAASSNVLENVSPHYERASRLYTAALALEDVAISRTSYGRLLRRWAEVCRMEGLDTKALELEAKANEIWLH